MGSSDAAYSPNLSRHRWLNQMAFLVGGLFFVMPYVLRAVFAALQPTRILESPNSLYSFLALLSFLQIAFSELWLYLLISLFGISLILAALIWGQPGRVTRLLLVLTLLAILAFPWFYHYAPAVIAAADHEMRWPTQPGLLDGVVKRVQITLEQRPCIYTLLGWSADETLYYQSVCGGTDSQVWAYPLEKQAGSQPVTAIPSDLFTDIRLRSQVLDLVRSPSVYPAEGEPSTRSVMVQGNGLASPDGQWVALIARHIYGPEDVLIVMSK